MPSQTELYLQVFSEGVSAEEMIPFLEIQEVQIRHKDLVWTTGRVVRRWQIEGRSPRSNRPVKVTRSWERLP